MITKEDLKLAMRYIKDHPKEAAKDLAKGAIIGGVASAVAIAGITILTKIVESKKEVAE